MAMHDLSSPQSRSEGDRSVRPPRTHCSMAAQILRRPGDGTVTRLCQSGHGLDGPARSAFARGTGLMTRRMRRETRCTKRTRGLVGCARESTPALCEERCAAFDRPARQKAWVVKVRHRNRQRRSQVLQPPKRPASRPAPVGTAIWDDRAHGCRRCSAFAFQPCALNVTHTDTRG